MDVFWEGLSAIRLPCTLALVVPALVLIVAAGRNATATLLGFFIGAGLTAWARFVGLLPGRPVGLGLTGLGLIIALAVVVVWWRRRGSPGSRWRSSSGGVMGGVVTAWLWQPCAGPALSNLANRGVDEPVAIALPLGIYLLGALVPIIGAVALAAAVPALTTITDHGGARLGGLGLGLVLALTMVAGLYDDIVAILVRATLGI